eukprot:Gb_13528 [translate_table: standard]
MDACHVLLGQSWQYDRQAIYDGRQNIYTIVKDERHFTFWPINEDEVAQEVLSTKHLMRSVQMTGACYALIPKDVRTKKSTKLPRDVRRIWEEYIDVTLDGLPAGLPPNRGISHQIDLIPRSNLPNQTTYRLNPTEIEEVNR